MVVYTFEQRWKILRHYFLRYWQKNLLFRWSSFWSWRGAENPHAYIEKPTHPIRVSVWCGFWSRGIIGQFFFENQQIEAVTVNGDRYLSMLNEFLFTKIEEEDIGNILFRQDAVTSHTAEATLDVLRSVFEDRIISRKADVVWPPRNCYWHHWTPICGVPSNIIVKPTSQSQLML